MSNQIKISLFLKQALDKGHDICDVCQVIATSRLKSKNEEMALWMDEVAVLVVLLGAWSQYIILTLMTLCPSRYIKNDNDTY